MPTHPKRAYAYVLNIDGENTAVFTSEKLAYKRDEESGYPYSEDPVAGGGVRSDLTSHFYYVEQVPRVRAVPVSASRRARAHMRRLR